jgi:hypothetical protein
MIGISAAAILFFSYTKTKKLGSGKELLQFFLTLLQSI